MDYDLITVLGPTASGKTSLAVALAHELETEIISGDSRQVYRRMDIGTGKDLDEYKIGESVIPYHLIDIVEPGTKYNVFEYQRDFLKVYQQMHGRGLIPVLCGGTGMYIESVLRGYNLRSVPENPELRASLSEKSLTELTEILKSYKQLQTAGTLSGLSYANAGCAAVHALSYPLSIRLKIPHGEANYLVFNEVLKIYAAKNPTGALGDIEEIIAATLNCTKENALIKSDNLCGTLMQRKPLSSYGMKENQILEFTDMVLTRQHMLIANGYVQLTVGEIAKIYKDLL